ncbi:serine hydroxymethyltransferase [Sneathiella limimaris]|uniref:serine hydroxymethyltransferase n=1 Tax=Sneathiella limimaris TaxID=1964213 RepID=UPI00146EDA20|nr:aminotransferase class I/II-fold pyridoxal phosphate-dependent enzyme [Sneathiella limimaris]
MAKLVRRGWVPEGSEDLVQAYATSVEASAPHDIGDRIDALIARNKEIHEDDCFNLNPATNVMNPKAEAALAAGLGSRPSLGYPGDKYEMGLEAIEEIEVIAAELAAEVFDADFAEIRIASGALANLYAFMATCKPGDTIIVPPPAVGGHVTHHEAGAAGLYGLTIKAAPVASDGYTVDAAKLEEMAREIKPRLITIGGSLNLTPHPVAEIRKIADEVGADLLFDAAHQCGIIAGGAWPNPLAEGADLMTMSTYKSLGGPAGGLLVTNRADLAEKIDQIAFPGLTANFDAAKSASLAISLLDWKVHGRDYAAAMVRTARALAENLQALGIQIFKSGNVMTASHQFAVLAAPYGGGQAASQHLRKAGFLACGIGLPTTPVEGDLNGLRIGTPELVRWGMTEQDIPRLAELIAAALTSNDPESLATEVKAYRSQFKDLHFIR